MKIFLAIAMLLVLSACAGVQAQVKEHAQTGADDFARAVLDAPCAMTYGAYTRLPADKKAAVEILCGGEFARDIRIPE